MRKKIKKTLLVLASTLLLAILIRLFVGEPCYIPSESMVPTILPGDWLWINKATYGSRLPKHWADIPLLNIFTYLPALRKYDADRKWKYRRMIGFNRPAIGDVVVFNSPEKEGVLLVKRVCGLLHKGDAVLLNEKNHFLMANKTRSNDQFHILSQNYYYVLGDNRNCSRDSRFFGYISEELIVGKVQWGFFSIEETGAGALKCRSRRFLFKVS